MPAADRIAYILGEYPLHTETFVYDEIADMARRRACTLLVLKKTGLKPPDGLSGIPTVALPGILSSRMAGRHLKAFCSAPRTYLSLLSKAIRSSGEGPGGYEGLKIFWKSLYFLEELSSRGITHLHAHFANRPADIALALSEMSGLPFSFTAHAHDLYAGQPRLRAKIDRAAFAVTCTARNLTTLESAGGTANRHKLFLVRHGVSTDYWTPPPPGTGMRRPLPVLLSVGRMVEKKGFPTVVEALDLLRRQGLTVRWTLVGRGKEETRIRRMARAYGLQDRVTLLGWQPPERLRELYRASDLLVQPSQTARNGDRDGLQNVLLEALACGLPVVTTTAGAAAEVIRSGREGILVPEKDPRALAEAIRRLLTNPSFRQMQSLNARTTASRLDRKACADTLARLFDRQLTLLNSRKA